MIFVRGAIVPKEKAFSIAGPHVAGGVGIESLCYLWGRPQGRLGAGDGMLVVFFVLFFGSPFVAAGSYHPNSVSDFW